MYSRALFPESRGDILGLIESMDRVPNCAESAVRMILNQHISLPPEICDQITELVSVCTKCVLTMLEGVSQLFNNFIDASITVGQIDKLESEADRIESDLTNRIFSSDMPDLQKILLRDLVDKIGGVADRSESVGDRIRIMVAKRSV
jgi:predicted phosphate transport protein (TIGR00153 family)